MKLPSLRDKRDSSARFSDMIKQIRMDLMRIEKLQPSNCLATSFDQHQYIYIYIYKLKLRKRLRILQLHRMNNNNDSSHRQELAGI